MTRSRGSRLHRLALVAFVALAASARADELTPLEDVPLGTGAADALAGAALPLGDAPEAPLGPETTPGLPLDAPGEDEPASAPTTRDARDAQDDAAPAVPPAPAAPPTGARDAAPAPAAPSPAPRASSSQLPGAPLGGPAADRGALLLTTFAGGAAVVLTAVAWLVVQARR